MCTDPQCLVCGERSQLRRSWHLACSLLPAPTDHHRPLTMAMAILTWDTVPNSTCGDESGEMHLVFKSKIPTDHHWDQQENCGKSSARIVVGHWPLVIRALNAHCLLILEQGFKKWAAFVPFQKHLTLNISTEHLTMWSHHQQKCWYQHLWWWW